MTDKPRVELMQGEFGDLIDQINQRLQVVVSNCEGTPAEDAGLDVANLLRKVYALVTPKGVEGVGQTAREWRYGKGITRDVLYAPDGTGYWTVWNTGQALARKINETTAAQTLTLRAELQQMKQSADAAHLAASNECARAGKLEVTNAELLRRIEFLVGQVGKL